jgi:hypothetical protein
MNSSYYPYAISAAGEIVTTIQTEKTGFRPVIVLHEDTAVKNVETEDVKTVKITEETTGIYVYSDSEWKECKE